MKTTYTRLTIRINDELHQMLTDAAQSENRSLNSEIARRIESTFLKNEDDEKMRRIAREEALRVVKEELKKNKL